MKFFGVVAVVSVSLSSCGQKKDYSGFLGTCSSTVAEFGTTCTDNSYSAKSKKEDPKTNVQRIVENNCRSTNGSWSTLLPCSAAGTVGTCAIESTIEDADVSSKVYYYSGTTMTADTAKANCDENGGTFTAN